MLGYSYLRIVPEQNLLAPTVSTLVHFSLCECCPHYTTSPVTSEAYEITKGGGVQLVQWHPLESCQIGAGTSGEPCQDIGPDLIQQASQDSSYHVSRNGAPTVRKDNSALLARHAAVLPNMLGVRTVKGTRNAGQCMWMWELRSCPCFELPCSWPRAALPAPALLPLATLLHNDLRFMRGTAHEVVCGFKLCRIAHAASVPLAQMKSVHIDEVYAVMGVGDFSAMAPLRK